MLFLRVIGVLAAFAITISVAAFLLTRNQKYLLWAWTVFRYTVFVALLFFGMIILERFVLIPL